MRGNFRQDLKIAEEGENIAYSLLLKSPQNRAVLDVRKDPYFQELDIDFLAEKYSGIIIKYEVKTDRKAHETGNIVFEKTTSGHIGCLEKSHADYILYFLSQSRELYGFWLDDIRQYIKRTNPNIINMGDAATGYLLKISDLEKNKVIKKVLTF